MQNSLERRTASGKAICDIVLKPFSPPVSPVILDVGARNGFYLAPPVLAAQSTLVGFEPNPAEYEKLVSGSTDASAAGLHMPKFKKLEYHNCALWDREEDAKFYITAGAGGCTLMGESIQEISGKMFLEYPKSDHRSGKSLLDVHKRVQRTVPTTCRRLDSFFEPDRIIDLLKLDVEGAELRVLKGASSIFDAQNVLFVYSEFIGLPYYQEHPLLGDLHVFLRDKGLRLLDIEMGHAFYRRESSAIPLIGDRPMIHAGDACFALDPDLHDLSAEKRQRLAIISFAFGFNSFAISLLREAKMNTPEEIAMIENTLARVPLFRRLKVAWNEFPNNAKKMLRGVGIRNASTQ